jgi:CrcB protein
MLIDRFASKELTFVTRKLLLVLAGGFCGAVIRYLLAQPLLALAAALPGAHTGFPYDTLLINLSGAFVIGLLFGAFEHGAPIAPDVRLTLGTGFLGAYTTFSSFMVGAATLLRHGQFPAALLYLVGAMAGGVTLAFAGFTLAGVIIERRRMARLAASEQSLVDGGWQVALSAPGDLDDAERVSDERLADVEGRAR